MLRLVVATAASVAFGIHYGLSYAVSNQNSYLLGGLRLVHPELLTRDWLAAETAQYHATFSYLVALLLALDETGWSFAIANVLANAAGALLIYWISTMLFRRWLALAAFLFVIAVGFVTHTDGVGGSYIFGPVFQPSTIGSIGLLAGIGFFLRCRWLASGIALALGGIFHANYLVLSIPLFGMAHLPLGGQQLVRRLVRQLAPLAVGLLVLLPAILPTAMNHEAEAAREILLKVRSPHHYVPTSFEADFIPFAGWQLLGIGAGLAMLASRTGSGRRLAVLLVPMLALVWVGTALTTATYQPSVAQLFVWRLAPFCDVLFQLLAFGMAARLTTAPRKWLSCSLPALALAIAGAGTLAMFFGKRNNETLLSILLAAAAAPLVAGALATIALLFRRLAPEIRFRTLLARARRAAPVVPALVSTGVALAAGEAPVEGYPARSTLIGGLPRGEAELYAWARQNTAKDALFLVPPQLENFRLNARRAVVVDWKTLPLKPDELLVWHGRLRDVTGMDRMTWQTVGSGYDRMDIGRLQLLYSKYRFDYFVTGARQAARFRERYEVVHENGQFVVFASAARR